MARIVFDLDGTLIDSAPDIHAIANDVLAAEGAPPLTFEEARSFIGNGTGVFVARMREVRGIPDGEQERLHAAFLERYDGAVGLTRTYPGVVEALDRLTAEGHALGVCTNKPYRPTEEVLRHLALDGYFGSVLGGDSLDRRKPDPAPLRAAFAALPPGSEIYVGDSEVDAETAARAEVPFLLYSLGYRKSPVEALAHDAAFTDWSEVPDLVRSLVNGGIRASRAAPG